MTLTEFLQQRHYLVGEKKCFCPFHQDRSPSAMLNVGGNGVYCFVCRRTYSFVMVGRHFHVRLDYDPSESSTLDALHGKLPEPEILFTYPWFKEPSNG